VSIRTTGRPWTVRSLTGRSRVATAAILAATLVPGLTVVPSPAHARTTGTRPAAPQRQRSVAGHAATPAKAAVAGATVTGWRMPSVRWPQGGGADLGLPVARTAAAPVTVGQVVGGLPLSVGPAAGPAGQAATAAAPAGVQIQVFDQAAAARAGLAGVILRLSPTAAGSAQDTVNISMDYSAFQFAYGGDWGSRLRVVRLADCALTTPQRAGCAAATPVPSRNTAAAHAVSADVTTDGLYALTASTSGGAGSYAATSLSPSSSWDTGEQTGDFDWSYPMRTPPVPTGDDPDISLTYSSQSVDGRTASTNNQTSWVGEGFDLVSGYVERSYKECSDAGGPSSNGDQCWAGDNATLMLKGRSTELIRDDATGAWHPKSDDGSKVEELTGASNGDKSGQYWRVTTTDGTQYVFGLGHLPGWASGKAVTNSAWTMPVYTTDKTDPCYASSFASSWCTRAWRWNLDYIVDPHGNASTFWYQPETNYYRRGYAASSGATGTLTQYTRGGYLREIDYGQTSATVFSTPAPAKVLFGVSERCVSSATFNCETAGNFTKANASHWPDVPFDEYCASTDSCTTSTSPSFWTRKRLTSVTTEVLSGASYADVDSWVMSQSFPDPGDGTSPALWLDSVTQAGKVNGSAPLPPVTFGKTQLQNRVDTIGDGLPKLDRFRVSTIDTESGGHIAVTYSTPDCDPGNKPDPATSTKRCYPVYWTGSPPQPKPFLDWFQKYVVTQVVESDPTGGAADQVTSYLYLDTPAWHFDDQDGLVKDKYKTWGEYRGYSKVRVLEGDPSGTQSQTDYTFLRGMNGDRSDPDDATKTKTVTVTDSQGAVTDSGPLQGFQLEEVHSDGVGGAVVDGTVNDPWSHLTATRVRSWGTTTADVVETGATHARTALAAGGWRQTETDTTYTNEGLPQQVDDHGDLATATDDQCHRTTYARNDAKWMIDYESRVETVAVRCAATPNRPGDVVSDERTSYDNQTWGTAPTKGDVTKTEKVASYSGSTPVYITDETHKYDGYGRDVETDDAMGRRTTTTYTPATGGPVTQMAVTDNLGYVTTTTLDPARGQPVEIKDPNNKITDYGYDPLGRVTQVWLPGRSRSTDPSTPNLVYGYHVDAANSPTYESTATLRPDLTYSTTYLIYDGFLRKRQTQDPAPGGGRVLTDTFYDSRGLVARSNGDYYNFAGPDGALFVPTDAVPGQNVTSYDGVGRAVKDSFLQNGNHMWDSLTTYGGDRVTETPPPGGTATTTVSDADGQTVQLLQYKSGTGGGADVTNYAYTPAGDLTSVTDATGRNVWSFGYNLLRQKVTETNPDTGTTTYGYDNDDELTSSTDARGTALAYTYDGLGRKTAVYIGSTSGTKLAQWTYDTIAKGRPTGSTRYVNGLAYSAAVTGYDDWYQPTGTTTVIPRDTTTSAAQQALAGTYTTYADYNTGTDGSLHRSGYPAAGGLSAETLLYSYDDLGQPLTMKGLDSYVSGTTYSQLGDGRITAKSLGLGSAMVTRSNTYEDGTNRLTRVLDQRQATPTTVNDTHYSYDPAGDITGINNVQQDGATDRQCFGYDYLQRLTAAWTPTGDCLAQPSTDTLGGPAPYWQSYSYDVTGNLTSRTDHASAGDTVRTETYPSPGAAKPHTVQSLTQHTAAGDSVTSYRYDPAGDLTNRDTAAGHEVFTWDAEGKLATVTNGGSVTSYVYDANGDELIEADPGGATLFVANMEIRADTAGHTSATRYYNYGGDTVAARTGTGLSWILTDDQNSAETQISADATQSITRRYYTPFGDSRGSQPANWTGQRGFIGGINNPGTGLVTLGARQYDPTTARFISHDPITDTSDPQQMNGYAYADDTPVTKSDPTGLRPGRCDARCWRIRTRLFNGAHRHRKGFHPVRAPFQSRRARAEYRRDVANYESYSRALLRAYLQQLQRQREQAQREAHKHRSFWDKVTGFVNTVAPALTLIAIATAWIPGLDAVTSGLALAADTIALLTNGADTVVQLSHGHYARAAGAAGLAALSVIGASGARGLARESAEITQARAAYRSAKLANLRNPTRETYAAAKHAYDRVGGLVIKRSRAVARDTQTWISGAGFEFGHMVQENVESADGE